MNLLSRPLPVLLMCCMVLAVFWLVPQARADLVINEIMGDPAEDWNGDSQYNYRDDEWIEVINTGTEVEDLRNYWLRDTTGDDLHLQLWGDLEPGAVAVFYGSDALAYQAAQGSSMVGFSINNSGDTIELLKTVPDPSGGGLAVVHTVTILNHEAEDERSSGRDSQSHAWILFDGLNTYSGAFTPQGTDCSPTPGEQNVCDNQVAVDRTTWDALKSQYR